MTRHGSVLLVAALVLACSSPVEPDIEGAWGGQDVSLILGHEGGHLQYQCGNGTIDPGWTLTDDGEFSAAGSHFFGGGPISQEGREQHAANYHGVLRGDELTLWASVLDPETMLGPFTLIRNGPAVHEICF